MNRFNIFCKAQGASECTERKPFEPEEFFELGRTRIGLGRSGCTEIYSITVLHAGKSAKIEASSCHFHFILYSLVEDTIKISEQHTVNC